MFFYANLMKALFTYRFRCVTQPVFLYLSIPYDGVFIGVWTICRVLKAQKRPDDAAVFHTHLYANRSFVC